LCAATHQVNGQWEAHSTRFLRVAVGILCDLRSMKLPRSGDLPNFNGLSIGTPYAQSRRIVMHPTPERVRGATMARHVFVVSRHHARLYDYLVERFHDDHKVEV